MKKSKFSDMKSDGPLAAADPRVDRLVLRAPVTDLARLSEFANVPVDPALYGFPRTTYFFRLEMLTTGGYRKRADLRMRDVVLADRNQQVDLTAVITPLKDHGTARHDMTANWVIAETSGARDKIKKAP